MAEQLVTWLDLSPHGLHLGALRFPDGKLRVILVGLKQQMTPESDDWKWALGQGFQPSISGRFLYREGSEMHPPRFLAQFPKAKVVQMARSQIIRVVPAKGQDPAAVGDAEVRAAIPLGFNYLGQMVYEGATGRFIRDSDGARHENDLNAPPAFLRGASPDALALCADGLVETMVRGTVMRSTDLRRFASIVLDGTRDPVDEHDPRLRGVQEAVEAAMQRRLEREVSGPDEDAFKFAVQLIERQPPFVFRTGSSIELQQYSTVPPLAIAAQHMLGPVGGKKVLEPTIGNASLVSVLPRDAQVTGIEIDPARAANAGRLGEHVTVLEGDFTRVRVEPEFDAVISNPPFGGLKQERVMEGLRVTRIDHLIMLKALAARKPDGRAVFIIGADRSSLFDKDAGKVTGGSKSLFAWLADHYHVEGIAEVDGRLYKKQGAEFPVRLVVVGPRRSPEDIEQAQRTKEFRIGDQVPVLHSWDEVWTFAKEHAPGHVEKLSVSEVVEPEAEDNRQENDFQAPYVAASRLGEPTAMTPRNLLAPTLKALERFEERNGPIDVFVADRLQMTATDLEAAFSPEQVDALGLAIARFEMGRGFILGDMTGQGKGRIVAGAARYGALRGLPVCFVTEKGNLFSDLWRDLEDIGSADMFKPMVLNDGVDIRGQDNQVAVQATPKAVVKQAVEEQLVPSELGFNMLMATYSQFNRDPSKSLKSAWLPTAARGSLLILDESHNAAGESNTGKIFEEAVAHSAACMYSSATFAKDAKNMGAYSKAFPEGGCSSNLAEVLAVGGEPLQEILSAMLAEEGAFIRREHDLSQLEFDFYVDEINRERNEQLADQLSEILQQLSYMAGDVSKVVSRIAKEQKARLEKLNPEQRKGNRMGVSSVEFGSRLYNILRQFQLALKVDAVVNLSLEELRDGCKPVMVVEQTMESLLKETLYGDFNADEEAEPDLRSLATGSHDPLTFRDVLHRTLDRIQIVTVRNDYGNVQKSSAAGLAESPEEADAWIAATEHLRGMIDQFPDLPMSPLDVVRDRIERAGFSCDEISGRSLRVDLHDDGKIHVTQRLDRRLDTIHAFNNGGLDAVELTRAGSTGLSLHSSEKFADQRQRTLLEAQIPNNVAERIQFFGRVNRRGQVCPPKIKTVSSGLPGEMRILAMQNAKLRKLSANTQSNRSNSAEMKEVPDIINPLGNEICFRYLENNPDIAKRLGIVLDQKLLEEGDIYFANKLTGYISLLRVAEQKEVLAQIFGEYETVLRELEELGENPFKSSEYDWKCTEVKREILDGYESAGNSSPFMAPVYLTTVEWEEHIVPLRWEAISNAVGANVASLREDSRVRPVEDRASQAPGVSYLPLIETIRERFSKSMVDLAEVGQFESVDEALAANGENPVKNARRRYAFLTEALDVLKPGARVRLSGGAEEDRVGIVVGLDLPPPGKEHLLGKYEVKIAFPGEPKLYQTTVNMFLLKGVSVAKAFTWGDMFRGTDEEVFDGAPSGMLRRRRDLLTGNLFRAAEMAASRDLGRPMVYTDAEGNRRRAVLIRASMSREDVKSIPIVVSKPDEIAHLIQHGGVPVTTASNGVPWDTGLTIGIRPNGWVSIQVPAKKAEGGQFYADPELVALVGEFAGSRRAMKVDFPPARLNAVLEYLCRRGCSFYVPQRCRDTLEAFHQQAVAKREPARKPMAMAVGL